MIYPATEKHIRKYEAQNIHLIEETPELYKCVTLPYLEKERFSLKVNIEILMIYIQVHQLSYLFAFVVSKGFSKCSVNMHRSGWRFVRPFLQHCMFT